MEIASEIRFGGFAGRPPLKFVRLASGMAASVRTGIEPKQWLL